MVQHDSIITHDLILGIRDNPAKPSLSFGNRTTGFYSASQGNVAFSRDGAAKFHFGASSIRGDANGSASLLNTVSSNTAPSLTPNWQDTNTGIGAAATDELSLIAGGSEVLRLTTAGLILKTVDVPANAADTGVAGQIAYDATYLYVCVAANSWTRVAIAAW